MDAAVSNSIFIQLNLFWRISLCPYIFLLSFILFSLYTRGAVIISCYMGCYQSCA